MQDAFHTPVQVLDREGKLLNLYQYDEFGRLTNKQETYELPFGYTGYRKEAAQNLYFAGAREYNEESGSFLTKDLWRYLKAEEPSTTNLYLYGKGNPLKYMDFGEHEEAPSWWLTTLVDLVSLLPVVGVIKYLDEAGVLAKTGTKSLKALYKNSDEIVDEAKEINRLMEAVDAADGIGMRSGDMVLKEAQDLTGNSAWRTGGEAIMEGARRLDGISGMADEAKPLWNGIETAGDGASGWNKVQKAAGAVIGGFKGAEGAVSTAKDVQKGLDAVDAAAETVEGGIEGGLASKLDDLLNSDYYKRDFGYDCSEIAQDFYEAAGQKGKIYRIEGKNGYINGYEYNYQVEYLYHDDGVHIYDPRYANKPVLKDDYFRALREINPDGFDVFTIK